MKVNVETQTLTYKPVGTTVPFFFPLAELAVKKIIIKRIRGAGHGAWESMGGEQ